MTKKQLLRISPRYFVWVSIVLCVMLSGCASHQPQNQEGGEFAFEEKNRDPFEGVNRKVMSFNDWMDRWFLKPVTKGYKVVTPDFVELGVSNFFDNLLEVNNVLNDVLQWKWKQAGNDTARLLINSVAGIGGLFDVATVAGFEENDGEDFGQTLRVWGVKEGPYIVLPFLGPSTGVDTLSLPVGWYTNPVSYVTDEKLHLGLWSLQLLDTRASLLEAEELITGDRYIFIREAYLQNREFLYLDGEVEDTFGGDIEDDEAFDDL